MTRVHLLRHGATVAEDVLLGRTDAPLSASGREGVRGQLAAVTWTAIVTSPLGRARESADIAGTIGNMSVEVDDDWREMDFGDWDGQPRSELSVDHRLEKFYSDPDAYPAPNGETIAHMRARVRAALGRLAQCGAGPVLVVAHGGPIRAALSELLGVPFSRLWSLRISFATRVTLEMGADAQHGLWGEIIEIVQPQERAVP